MTEKGKDGAFRWGFTMRANDVDPVNGWSRPVGGTARRAREQADEYLKYLVGSGGSLGRQRRSGR